MPACEHRIAYKLSAVDVLAVELYGGYLMIVVGGVIIYSLVGVVAGGVNGYLVSALYLAAAPLLIYRAQDMEELADAFRLTAARAGVHFHKCAADKSRL